MIKFGKETYKTYGECISITNGTVKMLVTIDIGPRIIFYGINGKNIMCEDIADNVNKGGEFFEKNLAGEGIWHLYGGHRLWKSPEYMDTYYPDNAKVEVKYSGDMVKFIPKPEKTTKLQKEIDVTMKEDGSVVIDQKITNMSINGTTPISAWGLTVMDKGAVATIPLSEENTGFLPNRNVVFWSYDDINDSRIEIAQKYIKVRQTDKKEAIKIGTYTKSKVRVVVNGMNFSIYVEPKEGNYPDYSCNVECYTNNFILEIETLSPLKVLRPDETLTHTEYWTLDEVK